MSELPIDLLAVSMLSPLLAPRLQAGFTVHDRLHELDPAAFGAVAPRIRAIAAGGESRVSAELIDQLPALELIAVMGVGYDGIDVAAAKSRRIRVTHTPNVLNDEVADLTLGLMLSAARQIPASDRYVRDGKWASQGAMPLTRKMSGARLGIVGMGRIGQGIARRAEAFEMVISYTARSAKADLPWRFFETPEELAAASDFLVVITPGGNDTRHLINAAVLNALGPEGILVNVARGSVVDEEALIAALETGRLGGAALDVFATEPHVPERLRLLPHVILTPHIGSATVQTRQSMADLTFGNLEAHFAGKPLLTPVPECRF